MFYTIDPITLHEVIIDNNEFERQVNEQFKRITQENIAICWSKLGELYRIGGNLSEAEICIKKALVILDQEPDDKLEFLTKLRYAILCQFQKKYSLAIDIFQSLEHRENKYSWESFLYQHRGKLAFDMGEYSLALYYFQQAKKLRLNQPELLVSTNMAIERAEELLLQYRID